MSKDGDVAIEATKLCEGKTYSPPRSIMGPNGEFKKYSWEYAMFQEWKRKYSSSQYTYNPNMSLEEWKEKYLTTFDMPGIPSKEGYYSPPNIFKSPLEASSALSGWDWWNASPHSQTSPFSEWD